MVVRMTLAGRLEVNTVINHLNWNCLDASMSHILVSSWLNLLNGLHSHWLWRRQMNLHPHRYQLNCYGDAARGLWVNYLMIRGTVFEQLPIVRVLSISLLPF